MPDDSRGTGLGQRVIVATALVAAVVVGCLLHDHTIAWDYLNHGVRLANPYGCSGLAHYACHGKVVLVLNRCNLLIYKGVSGMVKS